MSSDFQILATKCIFYFVFVTINAIILTALNLVQFLHLMEEDEPLREVGLERDS